MATTKTLDAAFAGAKQATDTDFVMGVTSKGEKIKIAKADLASVVGGLVTNLVASKETVYALKGITTNRLLITEAKAVVYIAFQAFSLNTAVNLKGTSAIKFYYNSDTRTLYIKLPQYAECDILQLVKRIAIVESQDDISALTPITVS